MHQAPRARPLLQGAGCATLTFLLLPAVERALSPLIIPLAEPAAALVTLLALGLAATPLPARHRRSLAAAAGSLAAIAAAARPSLASGAAALAAGSVWLALAPRYLSRRALTVGVATGFAAAPLAPLVPPGHAAALALAVTAVLATIAGLATGTGETTSPERRSRGLRLRGLLAFGAALYLDGLVRQELAASTTGLAAAGLAGAAAAGLVGLAPAPQPAHRGELLLVAGFAIAAVSATALGPGVRLWPVAAHPLLVLLVARALVPAGGRRPRIQVVAAWLTWAGAAALAGYVEPRLALALTALLLLAALALLPRAAPWDDAAPAR